MRINTKRNVFLRKEIDNIFRKHGFSIDGNKATFKEITCTIEIDEHSLEIKSDYFEIKRYYHHLSSYVMYEKFFKNLSEELENWKKELGYSKSIWMKIIFFFILMIVIYLLFK